MKTIEKAKKIQVRWLKDSPELKGGLAAAKRSIQKGLLKEMHRAAASIRHLKHSHGQSRSYSKRGKVSERIQKHSSELTKLTKKLSRLQNREISVQSAHEVSSDLYSGIETVVPHVDYRTHRQAVDCQDRIDRSNEDITAVKIELSGIVDYLKNLWETLSADFKAAVQRGSVGMSSVLFPKLLRIEHLLIKLQKCTIEMGMTEEISFPRSIYTDSIPHYQMSQTNEEVSDIESDGSVVDNEEICYTNEYLDVFDE